MIGSSKEIKQVVYSWIIESTPPPVRQNREAIIGGNGMSEPPNRLQAGFIYFGGSIVVIDIKWQKCQLNSPNPSTPVAALSPQVPASDKLEEYHILPPLMSVVDSLLVL